MRKTIGTIRSENSGLIYFVGYDQESKSAWISTDQDEWRQACENVSEKSAINCAQRFIDEQPKIF